MASTEIYLPFRTFPPLEELDDRVETLRAEDRTAAPLNGHSGAKRSELWIAERTLRLVEHYQGCSGLITEIQAVRIGSRVPVSIPGEMFVEWGLQLKRRAKSDLGKELVLVGLGNDLVGYIPSVQAFEQGCYETTPWIFSKLVPEAGQMIVDSVLELVSQLP